MEIVDFPMKNDGSFHCYVSSPEGTNLFSGTLYCICIFSGYIARTLDYTYTMHIFSLSFSLSLYVYIYIDTHTHIYIYILVNQSHMFGPFSYHRTAIVSWLCFGPPISCCCTVAEAPSCITPTSTALGAAWRSAYEWWIARSSTS